MIVTQKKLIFLRKRALFCTRPIRNRSQSFLTTPNINWAIGKDRESFLHFLFATACHKSKTSCPKVGPLHYCVLPYSNWDLGYFEVFAISIGKYTVLIKVSAPHGGDPTFGQEVLHLWQAVAKRKWRNHSRSFPMPQLMLGVVRKHCKRFQIGLVQKGHVSRKKSKIFLSYDPSLNSVII